MEVKPDKKLICLAALIIFAFLSIFSLRFRRLTYEAFECVLRRLTWQKCETALPERIKSKIVGKFINSAPRLARLLDRWLLEVLSWAFVLSFLVTAFIVGYGLYNLIRFGSCNPRNPTSCPVNNLHRQTP